MIALLLALHPRKWRGRYGQEFRALLESEPITAMVVFDVLRNAARQHAREHGPAVRLVGALVCSLVVEIFAVHSGVTDNILWPPSTPLRALTLAALLLPWLPVSVDVVEAIHLRSGRASKSVSS